MTFDTLLAQVLELLQHNKRLLSHALKRRFALHDDYLEDLQEALMHARRLAVNEAGRVLAWTGGAATPALVSPAPHTDQSAPVVLPPAEPLIR
ncbi:MAG TPA: hypothetical protein VIH59_04140 [Candidatus Tectomicrobia bacterium]|jgi:hypothetical protein